MQIEIEKNGEVKTYQAKSEGVTIDDFIRVDVLKNNLSMGAYDKLVKMGTKTSEMNLDIIDGLSYLIVFFDEGVRKDIGLPNEINDILKLPIAQGKILKSISKILSPILGELLKDFEG